MKKLNLMFFGIIFTLFFVFGVQANNSPKVIYFPTNPTLITENSVFNFNLSDEDFGPMNTNCGINLGLDNNNCKKFFNCFFDSNYIDDSGFELYSNTKAKLSLILANLPPQFDSSIFRCNITDEQGLSTIFNLICAPNCTNKNCGPDGCGGSCGTCNSSSSCNNFNYCQLNTTCSSTNVNEKKCIPGSMNQYEMCRVFNNDISPSYRWTILNCALGLTCQDSACVSPQIHNCVGPIPNNALLCKNDDFELTSNTNISLKSNCTDNNKCEYICNEDYNLINGTCLIPQISQITIEGANEVQTTLLNNILTILNNEEQNTLSKMSTIARLFRNYFAKQ